MESERKKRVECASLWRKKPDSGSKSRWALKMRWVATKSSYGISSLHHFHFFRWITAYEMHTKCLLLHSTFIIQRTEEYNQRNCIFSPRFWWRSFDRLRTEEEKKLHTGKFIETRQNNGQKTETMHTKIELHTHTQLDSMRKMMYWNSKQRKKKRSC